MPDLPKHSSIVIVGAGPTGLSLALALRRLGVAPLLLDKRAEVPNTSRAGVIHAGTLEALEALGVTPYLLKAGIRVPMFRMRDRNRVVMSVDFSSLPTRYPFTLMCPQDRTEKILRKRLADLGGSVEGGAEVVSIDPTSGGVGIGVRIARGTRTITADWVVACDGAHSTVRSAAGIAFEGARYEQVFVLADVQLWRPLPRSEVSLFLSPDGLLVIAPLPDDRFRIVATVDQAPEEPDADFFQAMLMGRGPANEVTIGGVIWSSRFHVAHKRASQVVRDRIVLCGDAAHVHSPAGGQGLNTGIRDAVSLAEPLMAAVRTEDRNGLETWAARRQEVAAEVIALTDRMTRVACLGSPTMRRMRNAALSLADRLPAVPKAMARRLAQIEQT